jgi:hypothetical protein
MCSVKSVLPAKASFGLAIVSYCFGLLFLLETAVGAEPRIDYISSTNAGNRKLVYIHFGMPAENQRTYVLQSINALPCSTNAAFCNTNTIGFTNWSNLATGFSFPFFSNHYIIPDSRTNPSRFYRLRVTP